MREHGTCIVCHGTKFAEYLGSTFTGTVHDAPQYFLANRKEVAHGQIVECAACGFKFTNPQFDAGDYEDIYEAVPRRTEIPMETADARRFRRLAAYVREDVGKVGRFLDFGCGAGSFLEAMNDPAGSGFEVGEKGTFVAGPSTVIRGRFLDLIGQEPLPYGAFDFITAFDVFEHLPELSKYVHFLGRLLAARGRLIITLPDAGSWSARLSGRRWNMYLLEHLWYFDERTLTAFMGQAGFQQIRHRKVPHDASLGHIIRRMGQTYGFSSSVASLMPDVIFPVPIGVMYAVFMKVEA
jgi:SAM-dependent methyltransferase